MYLYLINTYIDIYLSVYCYLSVDICKCVFKIIFLWNTLPNGFKIDIYIYSLRKSNNYSLKSA